MQAQNLLLRIGVFFADACGFVVLVGFLLAFPALSQIPSSNESMVKPVTTSRPVTVQDVIRMTQVVEGVHGQVAWFSPDGSQFLLVLKRGNLKRNTNDFELLRYRTRDAVARGKPELLLTLSSSSNSDAIRDLHWLSDDRTIYFLGTRPDEPAEVYSFDIVAQRLRVLTASRADIDGYDSSADGQVFLYTTKPQSQKVRSESRPKVFEIVSERDQLESLLCHESDEADEGDQLFIKKPNGAERWVSVPDFVPPWGHPVHTAPDGRHAIVGVVVREIPPAWAGYQDADLQRVMATYRAEGTPAYFVERYLVVDTTSGAVRPLLDTPMIGFRPIEWSRDSQSVRVEGVYLPLDGREEYTHEKYNVEVNILTGETRLLSEDESKPPTKPPLTFAVQQNFVLRPKVYLENQTNGPQLLLDPNPDFDSLAFGDVEVIEWQATDGHRVQGELFKPPDYTPGKRYPLVIQTHGFNPKRFWMDGPWSSAYSARPLAAQGILVLQVDYDRSVEATAVEGRREMASFEGAVDALDRRGLIDRDRVGISAFSRTVYHVEYALTHSKFQFAAANLVDGIDAGYLQYLVFGPGESPSLNDGNPFGYGLAAWVANSPSFQLARMHTPARMQAHGQAGSILSFWEWFRLLSEMQRPVELAYLPDAPHILVKPAEKQFAQESLVDWFRFWLKGETDPAPEKQPQYRRWQRLAERARKFQDMEEGGHSR